MSIEEYGWNATFARAFAPYAAEGYTAVRVIEEQKERYTVLAAQGEMPAMLTGKFLYDVTEREDFPAVGDWVAARVYEGTDAQATIHAVLPRTSCFIRKDAGARTSAQVVAANVDTVLLVMGLDGNFNLRRLERYLVQARESGAAPVALLTKADLCADVAACLQDVAAVAPGVPAHAISTVRDEGLETLAPYLRPGETLALLGSSGVGKSTLLNALIGMSVQRVHDVRAADSRGRHTTTHRELFRLPGGALIIDTPGMRELQLWDADGGVSDVFQDIEALAAQCRYADCTHEMEPGCAVQDALQRGALDPGHFGNYLKMRRELHYLSLKQDLRAEQLERQKWKQIHKWQKEYKKHHGKRV